MVSAETRDWIKVGGVIVVVLTTIIGSLFGVFASKSDITRLDNKIDLTAKVIQTEMKKGFEIINAKLDAIQHATNTGLENAHNDRKLIREDIQRIENNLQLLNQNHIKHLNQHK